MAMQSEPSKGIIRGVYIDTETGGLDALAHGLTEVAMVHFEIPLPRTDADKPTFKVLGSTQTFVKPREWLAYAPGALEMQSRPGQPITLEFLKAHGREERDVVKIIQHMLSNWIYPGHRYWNHQMWAQNADFDYDFMSRLYERVLKEDGIEMTGDAWFTPRPQGSSKTDWSCTRRLAAKLGAMGIPEINNLGSKISLRHLMELFGKKTPQTHGALQDCLDGIYVLSHLLALESKYYRHLYQVGS